MWQLTTTTLCHKSTSFMEGTFWDAEKRAEAFLEEEFKHLIVPEIKKITIHYKHSKTLEWEMLGMILNRYDHPIYTIKIEESKECQD